MRHKKHTAILVLLAVLLGVFALALVACGPSTGQPLKAIHTEGQLDTAPSINKGLCLSCHNEHSIIDSTEKYGGQAGLNVHEPPDAMQAYYGDCKTCHQVDESPVLTCDQSGCHDFKLPKGWSAP